MRVIDANVALWACGKENRFDELGDGLVAPPLMWSEALAALRQAEFRGEITPEQVRENLACLESCPVTQTSPPSLREKALEIAEQLGWAKTYDAEYVALAAILQVELITEDAPLRRGTARLGFVKGLADIVT